MAAQFEIALTFIIYLLFFAWLGYRRGFRAELLVFLVALGGWLGLQIFGDAVVQLANLGGKFISYVFSGGLSADSSAAFDALKAAPDIITAENREAFLFFVWVFLLLLAYTVGSAMVSSRRRRGSFIPFTPGAIFEAFAGILSGQARPGAAAPSDARLRGWAVLFGIANGLVYASVFIPRLIALLAPTKVATVSIPSGAGPFEILGNGLKLVFDNLKLLWAALQPQGALVLVITLTIFLVIAAGTLHGSRSGGSSGGNANANRRASS